MSRILPAFLLLSFVARPQSQAVPLMLRVLTCNIHHGEGMDAASIIVDDAVASDHRPLLVVLAWTGSR